MIEENARGNHRKKAPQRAQPGVLMTPLLLRRDRRRENMLKTQVSENPEASGRHIQMNLFYYDFSSIWGCI